MNDPHLIIKIYEEKDAESLIELWKICVLVVPWNDPAHDIKRNIDLHPDNLLLGWNKDGLLTLVMVG